MVGLLPDRPQRGKSGITNLEHLARYFEQEFDAHCRNIEHGRVTGEKALQSFLIREAYLAGRQMVPLNAASERTSAPVCLHFVTDELSLPTDDGKIVCDLLALRRDSGRCTPVLLELKDSRLLTRLIEQVNGYALLIDQHARLFEELYGVILGEKVQFDEPAEKWIVWPAAGDERDPRECELAEQGIRVVGYRESSSGEYGFRVGAPVSISRDADTEGESVKA